jgi:hypothetical protein
MGGNGGGGGWRKSRWSTTNGCVEVKMEWRISPYSSSGSCVQVGAEFKKSTHSNSAGCVEVGVARKSSHCANGNCVEVEGTDGEWVFVRDSKNKTGDGQELQFSYPQWEEILDEIRDGTFNWQTFRSLVFNAEERHAFVLGVLDGDFDLKDSV